MKNIRRVFLQVIRIFMNKGDLTARQKRITLKEKINTPTLYMSDKFFTLEPSEKKELQDLLKDQLPPGYHDLQKYDILKGHLRFYPGWWYAEMFKADGDRKTVLSALYSEEEAILLDYQSRTIYELNNKIPVKLSAGNVCEYVEFFFDHTRGPEGRMIVINNTDQFQWREEPPLAVRKALASVIHPMSVSAWDERENKFEVSAHLLFRNHLFNTLIHIDRHGRVDIQDRVLQVEDMPVMDDVIGQ
jgi:hypothetical protein